SANAVVSRLSSPGDAAGSGVPGSGAGARASPESGGCSERYGCLALPLPGYASGPGARRRPHDAGDGTGGSGDGGSWSILARQGRGEAGLAHLRQGMPAMSFGGGTLTQAANLLILAEVEGAIGHVAEGLRLLAQGLPLFEAGERRDGLTEAYRLQGALLLQQATPEAARAEACFQTRLALARRQQAKSWELRAAMSLAHLWQQQGKRGAAYALLAPIYGWFTEGFDTADLQDAKAVLEELGRAHGEAQHPA